MWPQVDAVIEQLWQDESENNLIVMNANLRQHGQRTVTESDRANTEL
jgi:hypothetical protein